MCTVTYIPVNGGVVITSNRDEQPGRWADAPTFHRYKNVEVIFPKDPKAGGTWFVADRAANAAVLMNGGFEKHEWNPPYAKSRGLVLLDLFSHNDPMRHWASENFAGVEPFTIILFLNRELAKLVWDGDSKHHVPLDPAAAYIWSSSPLYDANQREKRDELFLQFLYEQEPDAASILEFHQGGGEQGNEGFVIDRGFLRTVSITQARIIQGAISMSHIDLINGVHHKIEIG